LSLGVSSSRSSLLLRTDVQNYKKNKNKNKTNQEFNRIQTNELKGYRQKYQSREREDGNGMEKRWQNRQKP
tara:strand:- start:599 stop:811 length:213 start_codon:yes stop_codon:yes gene_type:complete